jgi:signal transduction histidine kinase
VTPDLSTHVLVIDDEEVIRLGCERLLKKEGYRVSLAEDGPAALALIEAQDVDVLLLDLMLPGMDGMEVLRRVRRLRPHVVVIVITGYATVEKAIEAMRLGAYDFVSKPFAPDHLRLLIRRALDSQSLHRESRVLRETAARSLREVSTEQSRTRAIIRCMDEAVLVTDTRREIVLHNPACLRLLAASSRIAVGKRLTACLRDDTLAHMVDRCLDEGISSSMDFPPGELSARYLRAHCAPVVSEENEGTLGAVTVFEDITELKAVDRLKSEFVSVVSHELRGPLATVEQLVYFLRDGMAGPVTEKQTEILTRIYLRSHELIELTHNLLDLSRLEAGTLIRDLEPLPLAPLLAQGAELHQGGARAKRIEITIDVADDVPPVAADRTPLATAISNLVGNAVKYTPEGGTITLDLTRRDDEVVVSVRDTGLGIAAEELSRIFDRFYRIKNDKTRWIPGSGLGLAVARDIVRAHGGRIEVDSEVGKGSAFRIVLPAFAP